MEPLKHALPDLPPPAPPSPSAPSDGSSSEPARSVSGTALALWNAAAWYELHRERLLAGARSAGSARAFFDRVPPRQLEGCLETLSQPGGSLVLIGPRGVGKTQLACYLGLVDAQERGTKTADYMQRYRVWGNALDLARDAFAAGTGGEALRALHHVDFLVLDEIQEDAQTDFARRALTQLVDVRYGARLRSIFIANATADELQKTLGPSAFSRLNEVGAVVDCKWEAYR